MDKEGKTNIKFVGSVVFFLVVMVFIAIAATKPAFDDTTIRRPANATINTTTTRNINFTFNVTWDTAGTVGNCSLWTNFTGAWSNTIEFNGTKSSFRNESANVSINSTSWVNYTFTHDIGKMVWSIACYNASEGTTLNLTFNANRTLVIDTAAPVVVQTADIYAGFNTSDATPLITINLTDVNGTGINLTSTDNNNLTLNITLYNLPDTTSLKSYNLSNSSLTCSPSGGEGVQSTQCTLDVSTFPLTDGAKNITVSVTDGAGWTNVTSFTFTVDQLAPVVNYFNITNSSSFNTTGGDHTEAKQLGRDDSGYTSLDQGSKLYAVANWTDNLTMPLEADLQFYNSTSGAWQTINSTMNNIVANLTGSGTNVAVWSNFSFTIPIGRNEFEGKNVSFRIVVNDTLGNKNTSNELRNITIQINDTYAPTITINATSDGVAMVNGSNITNTRPRISWIVDENNQLTSINVSVDNNVSGNKGLDPDCNKFAFYDTSSTTQGKNVEKNRNNSFQIADDPLCTLGNGTHFINVTAVDVWGNIGKAGWTFTVQSGRVPVFANSSLQSGIGNFSGTTNVTPYTGINFSVGDGVLGIKNMSWTSSCNSTVQVINGEQTINDSFIWPFNYTGCKRGGSSNPTGEANLSVTLTACDYAVPGTCTTETYQFAVDDLAPSLAVHSPTVAGLSTTSKVQLNVSAMDDMNRVDKVGFYLDGSDALTNSSLNATASNVLLATYQGENVTYIGISANFTAGTHTIKFRVNDSLGNARNSSSFTFTYVGPILFSEINNSIESYIASVFNHNLTNVSIRIKNGAGGYDDITDANSTSNTYEILYETYNIINVSLKDINGSAANWDKINFTPFVNNTPVERGVEGNWTNTVLNSTWFNSSIDDFISNNDYYGVVVVPFNISANTSTAQEFWWIENEDTLTTRVNITSQCGATAYTATTTTPCWNYTNGGKTVIYVPHFSMVLVVNDSSAPNITVNSPAASVQTVSGFVPNITVSSDALSCKYILNITDTTKIDSVTSNVSSSASVSNNLCTWDEIRLKNGVYNITYNVTDMSGNIKIHNGSTFTVSDGTVPNSGTSISASGTTTGATITISNVNESINVTVAYGTTNTSLTSRAHATDFSQTQTVTISTLETVTSAAIYYYNVTVCDYNGNCNQNTTVFSFTQSATAAAAASTTTSSSSSSGGGTAAVSTVSDSKSQVWGSVPAGSSFSLDVDKAGIAVTSVAVNDVKSQLSNVDLEVQALKENPVSTEAASKVYQYLRINKKNLVDSDAGNLKLSFRVTKAWLTENGLASGDISLYRYNNGWNELATMVTGTDSVYVNYEANTPGFSSFAIGVKSGVVAGEEVPEAEAPVEEAPGEEVAPPEAVETPKPVEAPSKAPVAWLIALVVVILGIILIVAYQKKKGKA